MQTALEKPDNKTRLENIQDMWELSAYSWAEIARYMHGARMWIDSIKHNEEYQELDFLFQIASLRSVREPNRYAA